MSSYLPPPPLEVPPPSQRGNPEIVPPRLGEQNGDLHFHTGRMVFPTLGPPHVRGYYERHAGPVMRLVQTLRNEPARLESFRKEMEALAAQYFEDNAIHQDYLMTRALRV